MSPGGYHAWQRAALEATCEVLEPWEYGTIARADRYPDFWHYNAVIVEREPELDADGLIAVADRALDGLAHRRIAFTRLEHGAPLREDLVARGWVAQPLVRMRHEAERPAAPAAMVEADYDAAEPLRAAWHEEDFPGVALGDHLADARQVELGRGARVLVAPGQDGRPAGFAQVEADGDDAEVTAVYVVPGRRGGGLGTALTTAAIAHAPAVRNLWISADAEGRPQRLYERLGFRPESRDIEFVRLPA